MKHKVTLLLALAIALAVFPVNGFAAAQDRVEVVFEYYDFCTGEFVLQAINPPDTGESFVWVTSNYDVGGTREPIDGDLGYRWTIDWSDPEPMEGTLLVTPPAGVDTIYFTVSVDMGPWTDDVSVYLPDLDCDGPDVPGCDMRISLKDAVVGRMLESVPAYWGPAVDKMTAPEVLIPWNASLWTFGVDESGEFRKVLLECTFLWVPADAMGPNYDDTWNGTPLPVTVVK